MSNKKLNNKGITIVEAVISMALLIVLTLVTLSLATSATTATNNAILEFRASNHTVDYIEVFQESKHETHFRNLIERIFETEYTVDNNNSINIIRDGVLTNILIIGKAAIIKCYAEYKPDMLLYEYTYWKGE